MNDSAFMSGVERLRDLSRDRKRFVERDRFACDPIGERRPLDELQHQRRDPLAFLEAVDGGDIRVIERRNRLRLTLEPGDPLGVGEERLRQNLQRDIASEPRVAGAVAVAHPARASEADDLVRAETSASSQSHGKRLQL